MKYFETILSIISIKNNLYKTMPIYVTHVAQLKIKFYRYYIIILYNIII